MAEQRKVEREQEIASQQQKHAEESTALQKEVNELTVQLTAARFSSKQNQESLEANFAEAQER